MTTAKIIRSAEEWETILSGQILTLNLLGKIFYEFPRSEWLSTLAQEDIFQEIPFLGENFKDDRGRQQLVEWSAVYRSDSFEDISSDYTRLFIGPGKLLAAPWESVYLSEDPLIFQEETLEVRRWFQSYGLQVEKLYNEPDDHVGLELVFLAYLANQALMALEQGDTIGFENLIQAQGKFLELHMIKWVPEWCDLVTAKARTDFYQGSAQLTKSVLKKLVEVTTN